MYAVVKSGGKQHRITEGESFKVEYLGGEAGNAVRLDDVLMIKDKEGKVLVGSPTVAGAHVDCTIVTHGKAPKIIVFRYIKKKRFEKKRGHRQLFTELKVDKIALGE